MTSCLICNGTYVISSQKLAPIHRSAATAKLVRQRASTRRPMPAMTKKPICSLASSSAMSRQFSPKLHFSTATEPCRYRTTWSNSRSGPYSRAMIVNVAAPASPAKMRSVRMRRGAVLRMTTSAANGATSGTTMGFTMSAIARSTAPALMASVEPRWRPISTARSAARAGTRAGSRPVPTASFSETSG